MFLFLFLAYSFVVPQDKMVFGLFLLIVAFSFQLLLRIWSIVCFVLRFHFGLTNGCSKSPEHRLVCSHTHTYITRIPKVGVLGISGPAQSIDRTVETCRTAAVQLIAKQRLLSPW